MKSKKKHLVLYELEINTRDIDEAEDLADCEETKKKAKFKIIKTDNKEKEWLYDLE